MARLAFPLKKSQTQKVHQQHGCTHQHALQRLLCFMASSMSSPPCQGTFSLHKALQEANNTQCQTQGGGVDIAALPSAVLALHSYFQLWMPRGGMLAIGDPCIDVPLNTPGLTWNHWALWVHFVKSWLSLPSSPGNVCFPSKTWNPWDWSSAATAVTARSATHREAVRDGELKV